MKPIRIGCSGWNYRAWRGAFYPEGCPARRWLAHYATRFDTVEVNATFYRLQRPEAVQRWVDETPGAFCFAVKASRYLTHMKRLRDMEQGLGRFTDSIAPLVASPKLGPVLWQLPERQARDEARLVAALEQLAELPRLRHAFEFRHPSWFCDETYARLHEADAALVVGDHPDRPFQTLELTAGWTFVRFHHGRRGRRGNYSETELREWGDRLDGLRDRAEVFAYFNNDWEAFAPRNAARLRELVSGDAAGGGDGGGGDGGAA